MREPTRVDGPPRLFAYGTLAPGAANEHILAGVPGTWEVATTLGHLVQDGWGAPLGYPALVLDQESNDAVSGMLLTADTLVEHWELLDEFEGTGYERVDIDVTLSDGSQVSAQTYVLRQQDSGRSDV